jgi:sulfate adenylyltransferase
MTQTLQPPKVHSIEPHGGDLVHLIVGGDEAADWEGRAGELPRQTLSQREYCDLEMLAIGAFSPLDGYMSRDDYRGAVEEMRLTDGIVWPFPITLGANNLKCSEGDDVALYSEAGKLMAILHVEDVYTRDMKHEASETYGTDEEAHPGVIQIYKQGEKLVGGTVSVIATPQRSEFPELYMTPAQLRALFVDRGWRRIVAFQTRNPIHRAHEYLTKVALEVVDGLLVHPLVGETKGDDVPADIRIRCYQTLLEKYYPKQRTVLSLLPASMRYGGPREAVLHAIMRKNYGCTHFIVGRDHAGANRPDGKPYYGSYDAHYIFDQFEADELGITPLFFEHTFFCKSCGGMASFKTCGCDKSNHVTLSGTKVREMLTKGEIPPVEFTRPEVAQVLIEGYSRIAAKKPA